jgi:hypothetical protein
VKNIGDRKRALDATKRVLAWIQIQKHKELVQLDKELGYGVDAQETDPSVTQAA